MYLSKFANGTKLQGVADRPFRGPQQAGERRQQLPHGVQEGNIQSPARREEQLQALTPAGGHLAQMQLGKKGPVGPGGH